MFQATRVNPTRVRMMDFVSECLTLALRATVGMDSQELIASWHHTSDDQSNNGGKMIQVRELNP